MAAVLSLLENVVLSDGGIGVPQEDFDAMLSEDPALVSAWLTATSIAISNFGSGLEDFETQLVVNKERNRLFLGHLRGYDLEVIRAVQA